MALTDEVISTLTEQIMGVLGSSISEELIQALLKRLASFGYVVTEDDVFSVCFSVQKVIQSIKNDCNIQEIPAEHSCAVVDTVCGEFLSVMYSTGKLALNNLDLDGAVTSVSLGDTKVTFENGTSNDAKFFTLVGKLTARKGELVCCRKLRW